MLKLLIASAAAALALAAPAAASPRHDLQSALDRVVAAGAPGAVALAGGHTAAAGVADRRTGRPLRAGDRVRIGSVTKSFTAVVALQLVGEGRLQLSDTVGERLPGVFPAADRVTMRQLLDHTSGIPDDIPTPMMGVFSGDRLRVWTPGEVLGLVRDQPLRFPPGTGWAYSNTDYVLVGPDDRARDRAQPRARAARPDPAAARPARHALPGPRRRPRRPRTRAGTRCSRTGAGPLRDLTRVLAVVRVGVGQRRLHRARRRPLLRRAAARPAPAPAQLRAALTMVETGSPGRRYGLGIEARDSRFGPLIGHEGDILGFSIKAVSSPDGRRQAVIAVNAKFATDAVDDAFDAAADAAARVAFGR